MFRTFNKRADLNVLVQSDNSTQPTSTSAPKRQYILFNRTSFDGNSQVWHRAWACWYEVATSTKELVQDVTNVSFSLWKSQLGHARDLPTKHKAPISVSKS